MRKSILYIFLAACLISCTKEIIETMEDTPASTPMSFNITVLEKPDTLEDVFDVPSSVPTIDGFTTKSKEELQ